MPPSVVAVASWLQARGVLKKAGVPLFLSLNGVHNFHWNETLEREEAGLLLKELVVSHSPSTATETPKHYVRLSGTVLPTVQLDVVGAWELSLLRDFLPVFEIWDVAGLARGQLTLAGGSLGSGTPIVEGYVRSDGGHLADVYFQDFFTRIKLQENLLQFSGLELQIGSGRLDGYFLANLARPQASYHALFAFAGIATEKLLKKTVSDALRVEGLAFGQGDIHGSLDEQLMFVYPFSGNIHLDIEPGRVTGLSGAGVAGDIFLRPPEDVQVVFMRQEAKQKETADLETFGQEKSVQKQTGPSILSPRGENLANPKAAFYWERLTTDISLYNSVVRFNKLYLESGGLRIMGSGEWCLLGKHWFDLDVYPSLKTGGEDHFKAWLSGDSQQTMYQPSPKDN